MNILYRIRYLVVLLIWVQGAALLHGGVRLPQPTIEHKELQPRRLSLFIDYFNAEKSYGNLTLAVQFLINLYQKASSSIIHSSVLLNFLERVKDNTQDPFTSFNTEVKNISALFTDWNIYYVPETPFFVFLKKTESINDEVILQKEGGDSIKVEIPIFKEKFWEQCEEKKSIEEMISFVNSSTRSLSSDSKNFSIKHFQAIFTEHKDVFDFLEKDNKEILDKLNSEIEEKKEVKETGEDISASLNKKYRGPNLPRMLLRPFHIVIDGHGEVDRAIAGIPVQRFANVLEFFNKLNTAFMLITTCSSGGKNINYFKCKQEIPVLLSYLVIIARITDAPTASNTYSITAIDQSMDLQGFFQALEERKPGVSSKAWLKTVLLKKTLMANWFFEELGINGIPQAWIPGVGWLNPIEVAPTIQIIHDVIVQKHLQEGKLIEVKDRFALLLQTDDIDVPVEVFPKLYAGPYPLSFTHWKAQWNGFPVLTHYKMDYQIDEKEQVTFSDEKSLKLASDFYYPAFIPVKQKYDIYRFKKIKVNSYQENGKSYSGLLHFIRDSFLNLQARETKKLFIIEELVGYNDFSLVLELVQKDAQRNDASDFLKTLKNFLNKEITLSSVFIRTWQEYKLGKNIDLLFEFQDSWWECSISHATIYGGSVYWNFKKIPDRKRFEEKVTNLNPFASLNYDTPGFKDALEVVKKCIKSKNSYVQLLALDCFIKLVAKTQVVDGEQVFDEKTEKLDQEIQKIQKNQVFNEAKKSAQQGMQSEDSRVQASSLNLFQELVKKNEAFGEAEVAALEGVDSKDSDVQNISYNLFHNLLRKGNLSESITRKYRESKDVSIQKEYLGFLKNFVEQDRGFSEAEIAVEKYKNSEDDSVRDMALELELLIFNKKGEEEEEEPTLFVPMNILEEEAEEEEATLGVPTNVEEEEEQQEGQDLV